MKARFKITLLLLALFSCLIFESAIAGALVYSTYLGGGNNDEGTAIAVDRMGNAYITGWATSSDFPTTTGAYDTSRNGTDAFVTKLDSTGTALIYSTYLGGAGGEWGYDIAVDSSGNAYVIGETNYSDFPTTFGAFSTIFSGVRDVFVTKLNSTGTTLVYSTYLGGAGWDYARSIALDSEENAYITGYTTSSTDFPTTTGAFDTSFNSGYGGNDGFVTKLNSSGTALLYSTYLGGSGNNWGYDIAVDSSGSAYITGETNSPDFPTTPGAYNTLDNGDGLSNVFVTKLNSTGTTLVYSTYINGGIWDYGFGIAIDGAGNAYITGYTNSTDFPTTVNAFDTTSNGGYDVFISKLNVNGTALLYSTYLGGENQDGANDIALDSLGNAYITGFTTSSTDFPTTSGAFDTSYNDWYGGYDVFVSKLNSTGTALLYSTYLGGGNEEVGLDIALDSSGNAYITGYTTSSTDFPTTSGAFDTSYNGGHDGFVSKLDLMAVPVELSRFQAVIENQDVVWIKE